MGKGTSAIKETSAGTYAGERSLVRSFRIASLFVLTLAVALAAGCSNGNQGQASGVSSGAWGSAAGSSLATGTAGGAASTTLAGSAYSAKMKAWIEKYMINMDTSPLSIADPTNASSDEVKAAGDFAESVRAALVELKAIAAPPQLQAVQVEFVASIGQLSGAIDKYVEAVKSRDQTKLQEAYRLLAAGQARAQAATNELAPVVGAALPAVPAS
jgi:hypothetical protein